MDVEYDQPEIDFSDYIALTENSIVRVDGRGITYKNFTFAA